MKRYLYPALLVSLAATHALSEPQEMRLEELPDPGETQLASEVVAIEMDLSAGRPMVEVTVNGHGPYRFVVDTGASLSVIDDALALELGLEVVGQQTLRSPGAAEEIQGRQVKATRVEVGGLHIAGPVLATMDIAGFSMGSMDGVLGRPHFQDHLLTFDYPNAQLLVTSGRLDPADPATIAYDSDAGSIRFPIDLAGVRLPMVLDTGSPGGITLPKKLQERLSFISAPAPGPTVQLVGGVHETWLARLNGTVRVGNLRYEDPDVMLTTFADDFGNLGFQVLRDLRLTVDQAGSLLRLERDESADRGAETRTTIRRDGALMAGGHGGRPRLGVAFDMTAGGFVKEQGGLLVRQVEEGSIAEKAGLKVGDIVLTLAGTSLAELEGVSEIVKLLRTPRPYPMEILRTQERLTIMVEPAH